VRQLYANLTPSGRENARAAILARAAEKANGVEGLSPDVFTNEVKRLGSATGVMFTGDDLGRVNGLIRTLDLTRRASVAGASPPTGVQTSIPVFAAVLADVLGSAGAAIGGGATLGGLARIYESKAVRDILLGVSKTKRGSAEEAAMIKRALSAMQATQTQQSQQSDKPEKLGRF